MAMPALEPDDNSHARLRPHGFHGRCRGICDRRNVTGLRSRIGFVLGALVASTDAIAATAIARRMHLPGRITDVLEGEGLVNEVSSLVALEFSVSILVTHHIPTIGKGTLPMTYLLVAGVGIGLAAGAVILWCQTKLSEVATVLVTLEAAGSSPVAPASISNLG